MKIFIFILLLFTLNTNSAKKIKTDVLTQSLIPKGMVIDSYSLPIGNEALVTTYTLLIVLAIRNLFDVDKIELVIESSRIPKEISIYLNSLNSDRINLIIPLVHSP